jgi:hypothetical protein
MNPSNKEPLLVIKSRIITRHLRQVRFVPSKSRCEVVPREDGGSSCADPPYGLFFHFRRGTSHGLFHVPISRHNELQQAVRSLVALPRACCR